MVFYIYFFIFIIFYKYDFGIAYTHYQIMSWLFMYIRSFSPFFRCFWIVLSCLFTLLCDFYQFLYLLNVYMNSCRIFILTLSRTHYSYHGFDINIFKPLLFWILYKIKKKGNFSHDLSFETINHKNLYILEFCHLL